MKKLRAALLATITLTALLLAPLGCTARSGERSTTHLSTLKSAPAGRAAVRPGKAGVEFLKASYTKREVLVPMRDGVKLFTSIYEPRDTSKPYPIILRRTPYSVAPYGETEYPGKLGTFDQYDHEGFIFVFQDVRGRHMSEGEFADMRPHNPAKQGREIDESSDTYDTIEWLIRSVKNNNGRVGQLGVSYPGFYTSAGMIDAHPALKAASPQAPIADWYFDDFHHHGVLFLPHTVNFFSGFGKPRPVPTKEGAPGLNHGTNDGYKFFLELGSLKNVNARYFKNEIAFWNQAIAHPDYDEFWQARNILPHLKHVAPAVMTVGGWFDAEDLYGALQTYQSIEKQNPGVFNVLVMGPWDHGGWAKREGDRLGNIHFGGGTSEAYRQNVELAFFNHHLKDGPDPRLPEAYVFETGTNRWRAFDHWPPHGLQQRDVYLSDARALAIDAKPAAAYDEFISDPAKPVPYTEAVSIGMTREYMTDDQRFASTRADVLTYQTDVLTDDLTIAGPITAELWVSTTAGDADWVVKVIDVMPEGSPNPPGDAPTRPLSGYQMMVRSECFRGRYREGYDKPLPFTPGEAARVRFDLQDTLHTFKRGHRLMVQIQSTWFPLTDRNPQKWVPNIFEADDGDFISATHRVYRGGSKASKLRIGVLEAAPPGTTQ